MTGALKPIWDIYFLRLRLNVVTLLTKSLVCSPVIKLLLLHVAIQVSSSSALWVGGGVWSATFFGSFLISCYSYKRALPLPLFCVRAVNPPWKLVGTGAMALAKPEPEPLAPWRVSAGAKKFFLGGEIVYWFLIQHPFLVGASGYFWGIETFIP